MPLASQFAEDDPALDTLMLPFTTGALRWPEGGRVLFLRARAGHALPASAAKWSCEQSFRPYADSLQRAGMRVQGTIANQSFDLVLVLPPRQRDEARALLARAMQLLSDTGVVVASLSNSEGARTGEGDLQGLAGSVRSLSKHKCRVFWASAGSTVDAQLVSQWALLDAPRPICGGRFVSRPGLFAWDRIDPASALLAASLPADLAGQGADLGAGYGYLAVEVIERCPAVVSLDLFEAELRALDLARRNLAVLQQARPGLTVGFHWQDVTAGLPGRYDFIVSNPPFHQGRADQPELGRAFILAAASALKPGGRLWLVANRHLPYETTLAQGFSRVRVLRDQDGFKVIEAIRAGA